MSSSVVKLMSAGSCREEYPDICVVTHPLSSAGENATRTLLDILSEITSVKLITGDLPHDSSIRQEYNVIEITNQSPHESIPIAATEFLYNQLRMCNAIRQTESEVILFFGATSYFLPILFATSIGRTVILEPRGDVPLTLRLHWEERIPSGIAAVLAEALRTAEHIGYQASDGIITYTPAMADELGLNQYKKKLHPAGARYVDTAQFFPKKPYEDREQVIGFLGRLDEEKGIDQLIEFVRNLPNEFTFIFAGDGDKRDEIEQKLEKEIANGTVEITGWVKHDDVPEILNRMKLLILPSQPTEGLPTVILEAMACGTPVYATPVSGVPDIVRENETGYHIKDHTPEQMAEIATEALRSKNQKEMSQRCRSHIENNYSLDAAVARYQSILEELSTGQ